MPIEARAVTVHGAGRTDAGVHALAQVASVSLAASLDSPTLGRALNAVLPDDVRIVDVEEMRDGFHARFDARAKTYEYRILNAPFADAFMFRYAWHIPQPLDFERMRAAAMPFVGRHDFAAFQGAGSAVQSTEREVEGIAWEAGGSFDRPLLFRVTGDGFLRHMVRNMVGTLVEVGAGRLSPDRVPEILASGSRAQAGRTAPAHGLFLVNVRVLTSEKGPLNVSPFPRLSFILQSWLACIIEVRPRAHSMSLDDILSVVPPGSAEDALARQVDFDRLPQHIAVIMDGNGRWAAQRHLPRVEGHRAGIESVREVVEGSARLGIKVLTLYAFSVENWKRPASEVSTLMTLLKRYLRIELNTLLRNNIRFRVIGRAADLAPDIRNELALAEEKTATNMGMLFNIALNYGGRAEIVEAARRLLASGARPDELDEQRFAGFLYTAGQPDPDLLIRTSGEMRVSNFLLWQIAYAEIWVTDTLWPDFRKRHLLEAVIAYQKRDRRYGGITHPAIAGR